MGDPRAGRPLRAAICFRPLPMAARLPPASERSSGDLIHACAAMRTFGSAFEHYGLLDGTFALQGLLAVAHGIQEAGLMDTGQVHPKSIVEKREHGRMIRLARISKRPLTCFCDCERGVLSRTQLRSSTGLAVASCDTGRSSISSSTWPAWRLPVLSSMWRWAQHPCWELQRSWQPSVASLTVSLGSELGARDQ